MDQGKAQLGFKGKQKSAKVLSNESVDTCTETIMEATLKCLD